MTREEEKKRAAAVAAVLRYMEENEAKDRRPGNLWARAGRIEMMQANRMVQMRVVSARRMPGW